MLKCFLVQIDDTYPLAIASARNGSATPANLFVLLNLNLLGDVGNIY
jgi:hypothetical protein